MLRLAEKRAKSFRNVTRNFACLLLVSRTSQENVLLVIQILTCKWIRMRVFITLLSPKLCHKSMLCLHCMVNNVLVLVEWDKRQISEYTMYINPLSLSVHILRFSACPRGSDVTKHTERYFSLRKYVGLMTFSFCHTSNSVNILVFYLWKLYVNSQKMAQLHCHQHFEINRLSLRISGNNIVYRNPWY